jgi:hypothetical protein
MNEPMGIAVAVYERVVMTKENSGLLEMRIVTSYQEITAFD